VIAIHHATAHDHEQLAPLFEPTGNFYGNERRTRGSSIFARPFLRLLNPSSSLQRTTVKPLAYAALPKLLFDSLARIYVLSDLFCELTSAKRGPAQLLEAAVDLEPGGRTAHLEMPRQI